MKHRNAVNIKLYVYYFEDDACTGGVFGSTEAGQTNLFQMRTVGFYGKTILIKQQYSNALVAIHVLICKHDN